MLFCPDRVIVLNIYDVDFFFPCFYWYDILWRSFTVACIEVHIHLRY